MMTLEHEHDTDSEATMRRHVNKVTPTARRAIYRLLDQHLDIEKRTYHDGWSDNRVAEEAGAHAVNVRYIRAATYCTLAHPARGPQAGTLGKKRAEAMAALEARLGDQIKTEVAALLELLPKGESSMATDNKFGERFAALIDRVNHMDDRLDKAEGQLTAARRLAVDVGNLKARVESIANRS